MVIGKIEVSGTNATVIWSSEIPKGLVGGKVQIEYTDDVWSNLNKTVVFRGAVTRDVLDNGNEVTIPAEVLSRSGTNFYVGVYGTDAENNLGIPTFWAKLGVIRDAADPNGDPAADPSLPVWARLLERTPDWQAPPDSDNHILNRTHWSSTEAVDNTFDGNLEGRIYYVVDETLVFVKMYDEFLTAEELVGATVVIYENDSGTPEEGEVFISEDFVDDLSSDGIPVLSIGEAIFSVQNDFSFYGYSIEKGVYFACYTENSIPVAYVKLLSAIPDEQEVIHRLDNKYINAEWLACRGDGSEEVLAEASQKFYRSGSCQQSFQFSLEVGQSYAITWDGERYSCDCKYIAIDNFQLPYIGNLSYFNDEYPDTGEPFGLLNYAICNLNLGTVMYTQSSDSENYHTVGVFREGNIANRIPFDYMPSAYTFPSDLYYSSVDNDQLNTAYFHFQKGGTVNAYYQGNLYKVIAIDLDVFDGWYNSLVLVGEAAIRVWHKRKGWFHYEPHRFTLCTSGYDEDDKYGKKFEVTISEEGVLQTKDITGYTTE